MIITNQLIAPLYAVITLHLHVVVVLLLQVVVQEAVAVAHQEVLVQEVQEDKKLKGYII